MENSKTDKQNFVPVFRRMLLSWLWTGDDTCNVPGTYPMFRQTENVIREDTMSNPRGSASVPLRVKWKYSGDLSQFSLCRIKISWVRSKQLSIHSGNIPAAALYRSKASNQLAFGSAFSINPMFFTFSRIRWRLNVNAFKFRSRISPQNTSSALAQPFQEHRGASWYTQSASKVSNYRPAAPLLEAQSTRQSLAISLPCCWAELYLPRWRSHRLSCQGATKPKCWVSQSCLKKHRCRVPCTPLQHQEREHGHHHLRRWHREQGR